MPTFTKSFFLPFLFLTLGFMMFFALGSVPVPPPPFIVGKFILGFMAVTILYFLSKAFLRFENIPMAVVHLLPNKESFLRLGFGLAIGFLVVGLMLFALFTLTHIDIQKTQEPTLLVLFFSLSAFIPLALMEELLFRGYPFFRLSQIINVRWVILITSVLFALYHYNGANSIASVLLGPGVWGVAFGVAAYLSKSIAVPLGMHMAANVLQGFYGMKTDYPSMWTLIEVGHASDAYMSHETLGVVMQLVVLFISLLVLEVSSSKAKNS